MGKNNVIRLKSRDEFDNLLIHVATDACRAGDYWQLLEGLSDMVTEYSVEFAQTQAFWGFATRALSENVLFCLARLYDQTKGPFSLESFLQTLSDEVSGADRFGLRVAGLDISRLQADLESVVDTDPLVCKLTEIRNRYLSHRDSRLVLVGNFASLVGLTADEIKTLLERAINIGNRYNILYRHNSYSRSAVGADDYKGLLKLIRRGLRTHRSP